MRTNLIEALGTQDADVGDLDEFTEAYLVCALWSTTDGEDGHLDDEYDIHDFSHETLVEIKRECSRFQAENAELLAQAGDESQNGHDFWLTRNGHGAGFWDRGYGKVGELLSDKARAYGECFLYAGGDGRVRSE